MRIDLYGAAEIPTEGAGVASSQTAATSAHAVAKAEPEDTATLSSGSLSVPTLTDQALRAAESRYAKVEALSRAVNSGEYTLDPAVIADAIRTSGV